MILFDYKLKGFEMFQFPCISLSMLSLKTQLDTDQQISDKGSQWLAHQEWLLQLFVYVDTLTDVF